MAEGFVYLLTSINSAPHVKIGGTENPPTVRIREINGTASYGPLGPWLLSDFRHVHDWRLVEGQLHQQFNAARTVDIDGTRELFAVAVPDARRAMADLPRHQLVRVDEVDRIFQDRALALYLERLFRFSGLSSWLHTQGAWTLRLFPSTSGGRYFTLNIGGHEVAWSPIPRSDQPNRHAIIVDQLIEEFPEVRNWLKSHDGEIRRAEYKSSYGRAVTLDFAADFAEAEHIFGLPGVRRALVAYWSEALIDLHERGANSVFGRYHDYNAVAKIMTRLANRPIFQS